MALRCTTGIRAGTEDRWVETTDRSGRAVIVPAIAPPSTAYFSPYRKVLDNVWARLSNP